MAALFSKFPKESGLGIIGRATRGDNEPNVPARFPNLTDEERRRRLTRVAGSRPVGIEFGLPGKKPSGPFSRNLK